MIVVAWRRDALSSIFDYIASSFQQLIHMKLFKILMCCFILPFILEFIRSDLFTFIQNRVCELYEPCVFLNVNMKVSY